VEGGAGPGGPGIADAPELGAQESGRDEAGQAWEAPELVPGAVGVPAQRRPVAGVRTAAEPSVGRRVSEISDLLEQYPGASPDVKLAVQRRIEALTGGGPGDGRVVVHEAAAGTLRVTAGGALAADLRDRVPRVLDLLAGEADLTRRLTNRLVAGRLGPGTFALAEALRTTAGLDIEHGGRLTGRLASLIRDAPDGEAVLDLAGLLDDPDPPAAPVLCSADLLVAASSLEAYEAGVTPLVLGGLHDTVLLTPWSLQFHEEAAECLAERDAAVRRALSGFTVLNVVPHRSESAPPPQLPGPVLELGGVAADPRRRIGLDELSVHSDGRRAVLNAKGVEEPLLFHNGEHVTALHAALALPMIRLPRLPDLPHVPRLTWGNIVISRRRWSFDRASFEGLGQAAGDGELLVAMARLRESHGLPVTFFAASPRRRRPFYVDTRSPALVEALGRLAATAERLTLTEVSPGPEECWLRDGEQRFAAELRCVYLRSAARAHAGTRPVHAIPSTPPPPIGPATASASLTTSNASPGPGSRPKGTTGVRRAASAGHPYPYPRPGERG
ncbi:lantibiotic dehydratase, partial [Nonomuraea terrae]|uniref:lantibiotic dehydratase n=1 Tax=Nonomuraea terrae TaxID=2530383 RepID=UPI001CB6BAA7